MLPSDRPENTRPTSSPAARRISTRSSDDRTASRLFPQIAKLTRGAYSKFDRNSPDQLRRLLGAVAAYAAGGRDALLKYGKDKGGAAALLTHQLK